MIPTKQTNPNRPRSLENRENSHSSTHWHRHQACGAHTPNAIYVVDQSLNVLFSNGVDIRLDNNRPLFVTTSQRTLHCAHRALEHQIGCVTQSLANGEIIETDNPTFVFNINDDDLSLINIAMYVMGCCRAHSTLPLSSLHKPSQSNYCILLSAFSQKTSRKLLIKIASAHFGFSHAEQEVLSFMIGGLTNKEIAHLRNVSPYTVTHQIKSMLRKSESNSRTMLIGKLFLQSDQLAPKQIVINERGPWYQIVKKSSP